MSHDMRGFRLPCDAGADRLPVQFISSQATGCPALSLFSNRTGSLDNRPSGNASLPDCFSFHRFTIGKRWGISSPKPLAWGPEPGAPSGRRSLAERRESQGATLVARLCEFPGSVPRPLLRFALIGRFYLRIVLIDRLRKASSPGRPIREQCHVQMNAVEFVSRWMIFTPSSVV